MATKKKMLMSSAGAGGAGGGALNVEDVFSTYLATGDGSTRTTTNGIDLAGEGGLVWTKNRGASAWHVWTDTERGGANTLSSNVTNGQLSGSIGGTVTFNNNGYSIASGYAENNANTRTYVDWTFRKAPKFFDVVTYTGTGSTQNISHNLGSVPAVMMVKSLSSGSRWNVYHKDASPTGNPENGRMVLNTTDAWAEYPGVSVFAGLWNQTAPTDSVFTVGSYNDTNASGENFVAYLFAHNNNDGEFGPDSDLDIIKCGGYTGNGTAGHVIDLGFEAQWVMVKCTNDNESWIIYDVMRGMPVSGNGARLRANDNGIEESQPRIGAASQGFQLTSGDGECNLNGNTYIYMAIRRGTKVPESATEVFAMDNSRSTQANANGVVYYAGFPIDFSLFSGSRSSGGNRDVRSRLTGEGRMFANLTSAETVIGNPIWDNMYGWKHVTSTGTLNTDVLTYMWKRAPGYFDAQAFTLGSASNREVKHNLAAVPEMIWWKERSDTSYWMFWHKDFTSSQYMSLHLSDAIATSANIWGTSAPTSTGWYMKETAFGGSGNTCISYTFASLPGISKVGSYTGNGSSQTIDCGFTSGARFVLIKAASTTGDWQVFDTTRGIVAGGDPRLELNTTAAEDQPDDIDPASSGFAVTIRDEVNKNGETFIFYAIA